MDKERIKKWINENLVMQDEARQITGQSTPGFKQSVRAGKIKPFVVFQSGKRKINLYLREELEEYAITKKRGPRKGKRIY